MDFSNFFYILGAAYFLVTIIFLLILTLVILRFYSKMKGQLNHLNRLNFSHYLAILVLVIKLFSQIARRVTKKS